MTPSSLRAPTDGAASATGEAPPPGSRPTGTVPLAASGTQDLTSMWWYTAGSLLLYILWLDGFLLVRGLTEAHRLDDPPRALATALGTVALFAAASGHVLMLWRHREGVHRRPLERRLLAAVLGPAAVVALLPWALPELSAWPVLVLWLSLCLTATLVSPALRVGVLTGGTAVVACLAVPALLRSPAGPGDSAVGVTVWWAATLGVVLPSVWLWHMVVRLEAARSQAAEIAVLGERLRFAADLHDVQGHHLQVIALHAELAERLLEAGDVDRAGLALAQVRSQANEALGETRALVRDLRSVSLEQEIDNAREVLAAAGATVFLEVDDRALPRDPVVERTLGLAVRETTTNVLRHARAHQVRIGLGVADGEAVLSVVNDGASAGMTASVTGEPAVVGAGTGLVSLGERVRSLGGRLWTGRDGDRFTFEVRLPRTTQEQSTPARAPGGEESP